VAELRRAFPDLRARGRSEPVDEVVALQAADVDGRPWERRNRATPGWVIAHERGESLGLVRLDEVAGFLLSVLTDRLLAIEPGFAHVHAGVASIDDRAIVVPGPSGAGKTTLALRLAREGALLTDEMAAIDRGAGRLRSAPRPVSLKWQGHLAFGDAVDASRRPADSAGWWIPPDELGTTQVDETGPGVVALTERRPGAPALVPATRAEALVALLESSFDVARDPVGVMDDLAWLAASSGAVRIAYEEAADAAPLLIDHLRAGGPDGHLEEMGPPGANSRVDPEALSVILDGRAVIHHPGSQAIVRLDPAGTAVWRSLVAGVHPGGTDVEFVQQLRDAGLIGVGGDE
jgi:hypothetical protein